MFLEVEFDMWSFFLYHAKDLSGLCEPDFSFASQMFSLDDGTFIASAVTCINFCQSLWTLGFSLGCSYLGAAVVSREDDDFVWSHIEGGFIRRNTDVAGWRRGENDASVKRGLCEGFVLRNSAVIGAVG